MLNIGNEVEGQAALAKYLVCAGTPPMLLIVLLLTAPKKNMLLLLSNDYHIACINLVTYARI
jgi:hypothetical protein